MNERIQELSEQAEKYADEWFRGEPTWSEAFESKFAELIIRECASLSLTPMQISEAQYYHGWLDYRDKILKHFGLWNV